MSLQPTTDEPHPSSSPPAEPLPEQIGRYRILERLGAGGMGTVYKAQDPQLDRVVALKLPRFDGPRHNRATRLQRFEREARTAAQVWHPHVCPIYDVGEHDGQPYVVMAYVEGRSLAERLAEEGRFEDIGEAVTLIRQVLDALEAIHARGIVHRDLKPSNILLDPSGRAVLTDFGLARPEHDAEQLTSDGVVVGTPSYMAPEQAAGQSGQIGPWTDLYSLGVVLYQMVTGRLPFEGAGLAVLAQILQEPPPLPSSLRAEVDPELDVIMLKALAKSAPERYPSARNFAAELAGWCATNAWTTTLGHNRADAKAVMPNQIVTAIKTAGSYPIVEDLRRYWLPLLLFASAGFVLWIAQSAPTAGFARRYNDLLSYSFALAALSVLTWVALLLREWLKLRRNSAGETKLMIAAKNGNAVAVTRFISRGLSVNEKDKRGQTALMKASEGGHLAIVKALLASGAEVNEKDQEGQTALMKAKAKGHETIVELLKQAGARE